MRLCLLEKQLGLLMDVDQECACCVCPSGCSVRVSSETSVDFSVTRKFIENQGQS